MPKMTAKRLETAEDEIGGTGSPCLSDSGAQ